VDRTAVTQVEAHGDYARLHTPEGSHLIRVPLTTLEQEWAGAGFVRIHRSFLVALGHVIEIRMESGRCTVVVGPRDSPIDLLVSRRHTRELRDLLGRRATS
jgi:DNA-binding LytR/AlgR family response regulator